MGAGEIPACEQIGTPGNENGTRGKLRGCGRAPGRGPTTLTPWRLRADRRPDSGAGRWRAYAFPSAPRAPPQQRHDGQAKTRPKDVQDDIVDVCSAIAPPRARKELEELDADRERERDAYGSPDAKTR